MRGGHGILSRFLLLLGDNLDSSTTAAAAQLVQSFSDVIELREAAQQGITLVRPDGYIAYAAYGQDGAAALASLRSLLQRQTNPNNAAAAH